MNSAGRFAILAIIVAAPGFCGDWNKQLAAGYLDSRQAEWFAWKVAKAPGGACLSCHTGFTYLLARPSLRRALGESGPTAHETAHLDGLKTRISAMDSKDIYPAFAKQPINSQTVGVESIMASLFLAQDKAEMKRAFDRMWSLQLSEGKEQGAWAWFSLKLDPWETADSQYYGAAVAAMAIGSAPTEFRKQPEVRSHTAALIAYLDRERDAQPLHHRLMAMWAATKLPEILPAAKRREWIEEIWKKQEADGGWTMDSLGPWNRRADAPPSVGSNSYATAFAAFALQKGGAKPSDPRMVRALDWLAAHQDRESGAWKAPSMNKVFEAGSNQIRFMDDAATAFAVLALLDGGK